MIHTTSPYTWHTPKYTIVVNPNTARITAHSSHQQIPILETRGQPPLKNRRQWQAFHACTYITLKHVVGGLVVEFHARGVGGWFGSQHPYADLMRLTTEDTLADTLEGQFEAAGRHLIADHKIKEAMELLNHGITLMPKSFALHDLLIQTAENTRDPGVSSYLSRFLNTFGPEPRVLPRLKNTKVLNTLYLFREKEIFSITPSPQNRLISLCPLPDGRIAIGCKSGKIYLWNPLHPEVKSLQVPKTEHLQLLQNGLLMSCDYLIDPSTLSVLHHFNYPTKPIELQNHRLAFCFYDQDRKSHHLKIHTANAPYNCLLDLRFPEPIAHILASDDNRDCLIAIGSNWEFFIVDITQGSVQQLQLSTGGFCFGATSISRTEFALVTDKGLKYHLQIRNKADCSLICSLKASAHGPQLLANNPLKIGVGETTFEQLIDGSYRKGNLIASDPFEKLPDGRCRRDVYSESIPHYPLPSNQSVALQRNKVFLARTAIETTASQLSFLKDFLVYLINNKLYTEIDAPLLGIIDYYRSVNDWSSIESILQLEGLPQDLPYRQALENEVCLQISKLPSELAAKLKTRLDLLNTYLLAKASQSAANEEESLKNMKQTIIRKFGKFSDQLIQEGYCHQTLELIDLLRERLNDQRPCLQEQEQQALLKTVDQRDAKRLLTYIEEHKAKSEEKLTFLLQTCLANPSWTVDSIGLSRGVSQKRHPEGNQLRFLTHVNGLLYAFFGSNTLIYHLANKKFQSLSEGTAIMQFLPPTSKDDPLILEESGKLRPLFSGAPSVTISEGSLLKHVSDAHFAVIYQKTVNIFERGTLRPLYKFDTENYICSFEALSSDQAAIGLVNGTIEIRHLPTASVVWTIRNLLHPVVGLQRLPENCFASSTDNGNFTIWSIREQNGSTLQNAPPYITTMCRLPGKRLAYATADGKVSIRESCGSFSVLEELCKDVGEVTELISLPGNQIVCSNGSMVQKFSHEWTEDTIPLLDLKHALLLKQNQIVEADHVVDELLFHYEQKKNWHQVLKVLRRYPNTQRKRLLLVRLQAEKELKSYQDAAHTLLALHKRNPKEGIYFERALGLFTKATEEIKQLRQFKNQVEPILTSNLELLNALAGFAATTQSEKKPPHVPPQKKTAQQVEEALLATLKRVKDNVDLYSKAADDFYAANLPPFEASRVIDAVGEALNDPETMKSFCDHLIVRQLNQKFDRRDFDLVPVPGDGNCMLWSIVVAQNGQKQFSREELNAQQVALRDQMVHHFRTLIQEPKEREIFSTHLYESGSHFDDIVGSTRENPLVTDAMIDAYIEKLSRNGEWNDAYEVKLVADCLQQTVIVFSERLNNAPILAGVPYIQSNKPILFIQHSSNHYDALIRKER